MAYTSPALPTRVATLALPTRESHVSASIWPSVSGTLVVVIQLNLSPAARVELTTALNQTIERTWKQALTPSASSDFALEHLLIDLNTILKTHEHLMGNPLAPRYHVALAVLQGADLALAQVGRASAFIAGQDRLTNLFASHERRSVTPTFQNLISGHLEGDEVLLLATPALLDYVSPEKLRLLIKGHTPGAALRELEAIITTLPHHEALALACLRFGQAEGSAGTGASLNRLLQTQSDTSLLLRPKLWTYLKSKLTVLRPSPTLAPETAPTLSLTQPRVNKDSASGRLRRSGQNIERTLAKLKWLTNRDSLKTTLSWWLESKLVAWRRLPLPRRVLLTIALVTLVAFSQSIVNLGRQNLQSRDSEAYNRLVASLTEQQAAVEGALIYHDDIKARALYAEAEHMLSGLPRASRSRQEQWTALKKNMDTLARRLERRVVVDQVPWLAALPTSEPGRNWQTLVAQSDSVYVASNAGQLLTITADGKIGTTIKLPASVQNIKLLFTLGNELLVTAQDGTQAVVDIASRTVGLVPKPIAMLNGSLYDNRLYFISPAPRSIFRTNRQAAGLAAPTRWLRASQGELTEAKSLVVDGGIWVARGTGVEKYVLGLKREFTLGPITPALPTVLTVYTGSDTDNLYLWTQDQRLVIYDKQGKLVMQLSFPNLGHVPGTAFDPSSKTLYLMTDTDIYRLPLAEYAISNRP